MDQGFGLVVGRLTGDPVIKGEENPEKQRALFTVAFNRGRADNRKSNFLDCIAWGKRADIMRDFKKGFGIAVTGDLEQDTFTNDNGDKRSRWQLNVSTITATQNLRRNEDTSGKKDDGEDVRVGGSVEQTADIPY